MINLQFEILNALKKSNGMQYIDVINLFPPQYTETRLMLQSLKKKGFVSFSSHDETNSFVKITPAGFCWLLERLDNAADDDKSNDKADVADTKTYKLHAIFDFFNKFYKFIIGAASFITAIGIFVKVFEFIF